MLLLEVPSQLVHNQDSSGDQRGGRLPDLLSGLEAHREDPTGRQGAGCNLPLVDALGLAAMGLLVKFTIRGHYSATEVVLLHVRLVCFGLLRHVSEPLLEITGYCVGSFP